MLLIIKQIKDCWEMINSNSKVWFSPVFRVGSKESEIFGADLVHSLEDVFLKTFAFPHKKEDWHISALLNNFK